MAKKKNRQINIARKRAKRQLNQKSKRKLLAFKKQQQVHGAQSDEARLQDRILKSKLLLDEPEFENVTFDEELLCEELLESFASPPSYQEDRNDNYDEWTQVGEGDYQDIIGKFRFEILPKLITPDFLHMMSLQLSACETRLKRMGYREKAEIAVVARSLFELADANTLAFHPLVLKICARTVEKTLAAPISDPRTQEVFRTVLSDVQDLSQIETSADSASSKEYREIGVDTASGSDSSPQSEAGAAEADSESLFPPMSPEDLPAKALYKNFDGLEISHTIEVGDGYRLIQNDNGRAEFFHPDQQRYIELTSERVLLRCGTKQQLQLAMKDLEELCGESLFYLAKTFEVNG